MFPQSPAGGQPQDITKELQQAKAVITKHTSGIIALPNNPSQDAIAAGTALYLALHIIGKNVNIVASAVPQSSFIGADKISTSFSTGGDNLVVSFPYQEGAIDRIDYNIEDNMFHLVIAPREGHDKLSPDQVQYTYAGGKADFIITVDTPNLNNLGAVYEKNQNEFHGKNIINIDRHIINGNYGSVNLVQKSASSTSDIVFQLINTLGIELTKDIATNLYNGIAVATNNFTSYSVNADTFQTISELMRAGAVKQPMPNPQSNMRGTAGFNPQGGFGAGPMARPFASPSQFGQQPFNQSYHPVQQPRMIPTQQPQPIRQQQAIDDFDEDFDPDQDEMFDNSPISQPQTMPKQRSVSHVEKRMQNEQTDQEITTDDPETWLKPKILPEKGKIM